MTPKQQATCEYLVTYRNPDGSLLLPQFGGCWHSTDYHSLPVEFTPKCDKCERVRKVADNPDLFTWPNFGILWEAMQARDFLADNEFWYVMNTQFKQVMMSHHKIDMYQFINPTTFPFTVAAYLRGLERC